MKKITSVKNQIDYLNALFQGAVALLTMFGATFVAILIGTIIGGLLIHINIYATIIGILLFALFGFIASFKIPTAHAASPSLTINFGFQSEISKLRTIAKDNKTVYLSILGISWFWFIGAMFLSQFPTFSKHILGGSEHVMTFLILI